MSLWAEIRHAYFVRHEFKRAIGRRLPALAAYMGHVSVASTQYYLSCLDAVAHEASERFERHCTSLLDSPTSGGGAR